MSSGAYLGLWVFMVLAIIIGIIYFAISGVKGIYKKSPGVTTAMSNVIKLKRPVSTVEKFIVTFWILLTIPLVVTESLQTYAAISGFFIFLYVVWLGVVRPTLK